MQLARLGVVLLLGFLFTFLVNLLLSTPANQSKAQQGGKPKVLAYGTVEDADGKKTIEGDVFVSLAGGTLGSFKSKVSNGAFTISIDQQKIPKNVVWPLMIKLSFHVNDKTTKKSFPPRHIEHLSPRAEQKLHVVVYTDAQLDKANAGQLFSEFQQLEKSVFVWNQANNEFKSHFGEFYSFQLIDSRRQLISQKWNKAATQAELPQDFSKFIHTKMTTKDGVKDPLKAFLPN